MQPKVSVIIPVYNNESYLRECLDSVVNQTMREIEIICVDDRSTDGSLAILREYAEIDERFHIIAHESNASASQCRKDAVLISVGKYVMFLDGDDYLELSACETAYSAAVSSGADILQYGSIVENCANLPQARIESSQKGLSPYTKMITEPLVTACIEKKRFSYNLCSKLFSRKIARRAFLNVEDGCFPKANDVYAMFFLLQESRRYHGLETPLYHYCFGRGMTGQNSMTIEQFERQCQSARVYRALDKYVTALENGDLEDSRNPESTAAARSAVEALKKRFIDELLARWLANVPPAFRADAYCAMERAWEVTGTEFVAILADRGWYRRKEIADALWQSDRFLFRKRQIRTIALYYHSIRRGGAQRVVAMLCKQFADYREEAKEHPYRVVLITDEISDDDSMTAEEIAKEEYEISPLVIRETLPAESVSRGSKYKARAKRLEQIVTKYDIDAVLYSQWTAPSVFWDMLCVKQLPSHPAFIVHMHSFCGFLYQAQSDMVDEKTAAFRMADGLVGLSELDRLYWRRVNSNVYCIPNPCFTRASQNKRANFNKNIVWVARLSEEKQPMHIIDIMEKVVLTDHEAVCHVVGNDVSDFTQQMRTEIAARGLEESIILEGFQTDVTPFYENAAVFLMTSQFEGSPLTLFEACSFGLPVVMYDLPWLAFYEIMDGWSSVPQGNTTAAAQAILQLIENEEEWQKRSDAAFKSALEFEKHDVIKKWSDVFQDLENGIPADGATLDEMTRLYIDQITFFHGKAVRGLTGRINADRKQLEEARKQINTTQEQLAIAHEQINKNKHTRSYRIGRIITWPARMVRGAVRCCRKHGLRHTINRAAWHIKSILKQPNERNDC